VVPSTQIAPTRVVPVLLVHQGFSPGAGGGGVKGFVVAVGCGAAVGLAVGMAVGIGAVVGCVGGRGVSVGSRLTMGRYDTGATSLALAGQVDTNIMLTQMSTSVTMEPRCFIQLPFISIYEHPQPAVIPDLPCAALHAPLDADYVNEQRQGVKPACFDR
jgi:hypothetical protein